MPLLLCPNDNASMQTVQRQGVEFDMCPQCRGVWLDRGELEKLIQGDSRPQAAPEAVRYVEPQPYQQPPQQPYQQQPRYDDRRRDDDDDDYRRKGGYENRPYKKRESWWSEIFD